MPKIDFDVDQNSVDWMKIHSTIPTASRFSDILTPKKMEMSASRKKYICEIIAARLLNWQPTSLDKIEHIEAGRRNEPIAVAQLELIREVETRKVGIIRTNDLRFGASPDRVVMKGDAVEITVEVKCPQVVTQMQYLLRDELALMKPVSSDIEVYKCQRQGQLLIAEADEAIFYSYNERMPPVYERTHRDEPFLKKLQDALEQFSDELDLMDQKARSLGLYQAYAEMKAPIDVERGGAWEGDNAVEQILTSGNWGG